MYCNNVAPSEKQWTGPLLRNVESSSLSVSRIAAATVDCCLSARASAPSEETVQQNTTQMDISVTLISIFFFTKPDLGFGSDQDYQIDIINELDLANATYGITQVEGLHNSSKAFLFR
ncbi:hypothetical protein NHX12_005706, partial [Muraenolepis orangiensis]